MTNPLKTSWQETERNLNSIFENYPAEFQPLIEPQRAARVPYAADIAHLKRFIELWRGDGAFREAYPSDPARVASEYGLRLNLEAAQFLLEQPLGIGPAPDDNSVPLDARRYRLFLREKLLHREKVRSVECVPAEPRHRAWRERQMNRCLGHLGPMFSEAIVHAPFAIEITEGCSVGCWFCGVSAKKKKGDFAYTEQNASLWRDVLAVLRDRVGEAAKTGFLYWASDPLDNPEYEKFALDFAQICGCFPQTTTAIAHKDVERTGAILRMSIEQGCTINRFSVISFGQFKKIMAAFTPEELLHCEIVPQHPEAVQIQSNAGRARNSGRLRERAEAKGAEATQWASGPGTIACVSGFLINMPLGRVRLITPCPASDRWPDGYWILEEGFFETAADLDAILEGMATRHMPLSVRAADTPRFRHDLQFEPIDQGLLLRAHGSVATFKGIGQSAFGAAIAEGRRTVGDIVIEMEREFGLPLVISFQNLNQLLDGGFLDEEPAPAAPAANGAPVLTHASQA